MHTSIHPLIKPLLTGALLTFVPLTAQGPGPGHGPRHEQCPGFDFPGLTDAQKTSLKTIAEKHKTALDTMRKAEREAQIAFQKAMQDPATKEADLKAAFEKASQARLESILEQRSLMQESLGVLSAEQKAELQKRRPEGAPPFCGGPRHEGTGPRHGMMPPPPPPPHGQPGPLGDGPEGPDMDEFPEF